ncbi:MAG: WGR domain-containing protein [Anaerolineae bacterium]|nr:WGR domain-containing protein [Anaerolineae bacterium]
MLLHRIDPAKNMARFYLVEAAPSLLDSFAVLRVWGRIGGAQQHKITPCASAAEAEQLAERLIKRKIKRGYKVAGDSDEQEKEKVNPQGAHPFGYSQGSQPEPAAATGNPASRPAGGQLSGVRRGRQRAPDRKLPQPDPAGDGPLQIELL